MRDGDQHGPPSTAKPRRTCRTPTSTRTAASRRGPDRQGRTSDTTGVAVALSADSGNCPWPMLAVPGGPRRRLPGGVGRQHGRGRRRSRRWRRPARQEAADALAAPAEAGRQLVQAAEAAALRVRAQAEVATADAGYAGAWQAARDAGAAARPGLPPARRPANSAATADPSATTAS